MFYSTIDYLSGSRENLIFKNHEEAQTFMDEVKKKNGEGLVYCNNNDNALHINLKNVEKIYEPIEYKETEHTNILTDFAGTISKAI
ncbi:hypothetical protein QUF84_00605 [Fictibacillus enclensis]|uniref:hypothetical protein n=1 Tax=Fictibacillus enclensis TaxID=1017270 RepID=UPI0025A24894|nr:hypothetical protein [Fictibacillus enclensis]MDM5335797.1 hypothetical protein [Fictibacillus enclensis]